MNKAAVTHRCAVWRSWVCLMIFSRLPGDFGHFRTVCRLREVMDTLEAANSDIR